MNDLGEIHEHLTDLRRVIRGIEVFAGQTFQQMRDHYELHEEDKLCDVSRPDGRGIVLCTRDALQAITGMAERYVAALPESEDYAVLDIVKAIRRRIAKALIEEESDEAVVERVLREAREEVEKSHTERMFHFPCVLVSSNAPVRFPVGPVIFTPIAFFMDSKKEAVRQFIESGTDPTTYQAWVGRFESHAAAYGWVASVKVPACAPSIAQVRAERASTAAINFIRLFMGAGYARDMRLAHSFSSSPANYDFAVETAGKFNIWSTRKVPGAIVDDSWAETIRGRAPRFWFEAGGLVAAITRGRMSEMASRMTDALSWFGEAVFEVSPGKQIAKFEAALERLTVTSRFGLHSFCARVALLAMDGTRDDVEECYWKAFSIHEARSQIVHGTVSPNNLGFRTCLGLAHEVTRTALFRGLEMYWHLDASGVLSTIKCLDDHYNKRMSPHAATISGLRKELNARRA